LSRRALPHWVSLALALSLYPALRAVHLPCRFDWLTLGVAYWIILAAQSIFVAVLLAAIGMSNVLRPWRERYRKQPFRIVAALIFLVILIFATSPARAVVLTVDTLALLELVDRGKLHRLGAAAKDILPPAAYLFFGFLMVLAYNYAIVTTRYNFAYDPAMAAIDRWLLHGHTVSDLTHWAVERLPPSFFHAMEFIYFGMFPQIGATIILLALLEGRARSLQFVGTILLSYYFALTLFYLWPAQGPYYLCPDHFARFPASLQSYNIQKNLIRHALALWHHEPVSRISADYFIGFPCMHIVQPLIVLWYLRPWRRAVLFLAAYDIVLIIAILMLEMHYAVDFLAGILVAVLAIAISGGHGLSLRGDRGAHDTRQNPAALAT